MAYDKIIPIHKRLDHCVDYVRNLDKTGLAAALGYISDTRRHGDTVVLETGINCQAETAYAEMKATKRRWDKRSGVLGYHLIHSYSPGEVTPEEAHAAGVEFARSLLGDRYEAIVETHIDHDHLHNHIVFNSVSFVDGKKFRNDFSAYYGEIRETSNAVSKARGLSVIQPQGKGKSYAEWNAEQHGKPTIRGMVKQDIDKALSEAYTMKSFWAALEKMGYQIKRGANVKHTAVKPKGGQRFIRLDGLGEGYTEAELLERIGKTRTEPRTAQPLVISIPVRHYRWRGRFKPRKKVTGFRALYFRYLYLLNGRSPRRRPIPFSVRKEVIKLNQYVEQFNFLQTHGIDTDTQLSDLSAFLQGQIDRLEQERKALYREKRLGYDVELEIVKFNEELRPLRRELRLCMRISENIPVIRDQVEQCRESPNKTEKAKTRRKERSHGR